MTPADVAARVERELSAFRAGDPPAGPGLLGRPWSADRVARGVEALRTALVPPRPVALLVPPGAGGAERRKAWVVASARGMLVVLNPAAGEFALADPAGEGEAVDLDVRGDLVGTFLAA